MRYLRILLTGCCLLTYLQSACLPLDLILSGLQLTEKRHVCSCKLTGVHGDWCHCPCCVGGKARVVEAPPAHSCCVAKKTAAQADLRLLPMGCGCGVRTDFTLSAPRLALYLYERSILLEITGHARELADPQVSHPYSIRPDLPDKIPI